MSECWCGHVAMWDERKSQKVVPTLFQILIITPRRVRTIGARATMCQVRHLDVEAGSSSLCLLMRGSTSLSAVFTVHTALRKTLTWAFRFNWNTVMWASRFEAQLHSLWGKLNCLRQLVTPSSVLNTWLFWISARIPNMYLCSRMSCRISSRVWPALQYIHGCSESVHCSGHWTMYSG